MLGCPSFRTATPEQDGNDGGDAGVDTDGVSGDSGFSIVYHEPEAGAFRSVWVGGPEDVYIGGDDGALMEKNGDDWKHVVLGVGVNVTGVWASSPNEALAVATQKNTNKGPVYRRTNGRWVQIGTAPHGLHAVWGIDDMRFTSGNDGVVYSGPPNDPLSMGTQISPNAYVQETVFAPIGFSIGGNSKTSVMVAHDFDLTTYFDGAIWHSYADPIDRTRSFRAIWAAPGPTTAIYEGANYYGLWHFTGGANPVSELNEEKDKLGNEERWIWGIWGPSADKIICVGSSGRIMTYDRVSGRVIIRPSPTGKDLYAIGGTSFEDIWIVGEEQLVLHGRIDF